MKHSPVGPCYLDLLPRQDAWTLQPGQESGSRMKLTGVLVVSSVYIASSSKHKERRVRHPKGVFEWLYAREKAEAYKIIEIFPWEKQVKSMVKVLCGRSRASRTICV